MSRKLGIVAAITIVALLAVPISPASGASGFASAFVGKAKLNATICYPTLGCNKGATIGFTATAGSTQTDPQPTACVAVSAGKVTDAGTCGLTAGGTLTAGPLGGPWCGHSQGTFDGQLTVEPSGNQVGFSATWVSAGGTLVILGSASGGGQTGTFVSLVNAGPDATKGDSCTTGANDFLFAGISAGALGV